LHKPQYPKIPKASSQLRPRNLSRHPCHKWYRCCFSPCERYITVIKGSGLPDALRMFSSWILDVHERIGDSAHFQRLATTGIRLNGRASHGMTFHPTKPVLALCLLNLTVLWQYSKKGGPSFSFLGFERL
jgi:hypothetical protein